MSEFFKGAKPFTTLLLLALTAFIFSLIASLPIKIDAAQVEQTRSERLKLQDVRNDINGWRGDILTFCDTANGNLIYVLAGPEKGGIAVVPNNCQKNPR